MANHSFINLSPETSIFRIKDAVHCAFSRFKEDFRLDEVGEDGLLFWSIHPQDHIPEEYIIQNTVSFWINEDGQLEFTTPYKDFSYWMISYIQNEIALELGGYITDEAISEKIFPKPSKYDFYEDYVKLFVSDHMTEDHKNLVWTLRFDSVTENFDEAFYAKYTTKERKK